MIPTIHLFSINYVLLQKKGTHLEKRINHAEELIPRIQQRFAEQPRDHWIAALNAEQVPSGPVFTHEELRREPQVAEMNLLPTVHHPVAGETQMVGPPVVFHGSPTSIRRPAPMQGQHTEEILRELGYASDKIQSLQTSDVVRQWQPG